MPRTLTVGAAQLGPISKNEPRAHVIERLHSLMLDARAAGCDVVVYPELSLTTFFPRWYAEDPAEMDCYFESEMPGPETQYLFDEAKRLGIGFHLGYAETVNEDGRKRHFNTAILVDKTGKLIGKYRKVHLPGSSEIWPGRPGQHLEKRYFEVGNLGYPVWKAFGGFIGTCICNDRRWPEVYRVMGLQGVEIIFMGYNTSVGLGDPYEVDALAQFHNHLCMQAGAYQNATWVVGVAKAGCEEGFNMIGQSCVIAPSGEIVAMCSSLGDELIVHKCDLDAGQPYKADIFNFVAHRQPETYGLIVERVGAMANGCGTDAMKAHSNSPRNARAVGRIVYVDGDFVAEADAKVSIFDRGLLFADAVYEGLGVLDGRIIEFAAHMARLRRSLGELSIPEPMSQDGFFAVLMALVERNQVKEGFLYLHITRGTADRDYLYAPDMTPTVFAFSQDQVPQPADLPARAIRLQSAPDLRWARRDIKTSNLLGQVMAKQAARLAGADEALMVGADGFVTEGGATSFFTVKDSAIVARPVSNDILHGITRQSMLKIAEAEGLRIETRKITLDETYAADEAFLTGASSYVEPVGTIDGHTIGNGQPGPVTLKLRTEYLRYARSTFYEPS